MIKPIKIVTGLKPCDVKIYEDGIEKDIDNIYGIDIQLRVDKVPKVIYHRYASKVEYEGEKCAINIADHKPLKVKDADTILEDTNYSNCKNGKHFIKKEKRKVKLKEV
jgi:hypothetical protein